MSKKSVLVLTIASFFLLGMGSASAQGMSDEEAARLAIKERYANSLDADYDKTIKSANEAAKFIEQLFNSDRQTDVVVGGVWFSENPAIFKHIERTIWDFKYAIGGVHFTDRIIGVRLRIE